MQLQGTESSMYIDLLRVFAYGTWTKYKSDAAHLPELVPDQAVKLKQLSVLTLAETNKNLILHDLSYDQLMAELEIANVRELEDFLINECIFVGIVKGKLNPLRRCFEVKLAAGRDVRPGQLENIMLRLTNWLNISDSTLSIIQDKTKWAETMSGDDKKHKMEVKNRLQDVKKSLRSNVAVNEDAAYVALLEDLPEEDANQYDPVQQQILDDVAARVKIVVLKQYVKEQRESMLEEHIKESSKLAQLEAVKDELKAILEKLDSWGRAEFLWESDFKQFTEMWRWFRIQRGPKRIEINLAIKYADSWQVHNIEDHINTGEARGLGFSTVYSGYDKQIGRKIVSPDREYVKDSYIIYFGCVYPIEDCHRLKLFLLKGSRRYLFPSERLAFLLNLWIVV
ncbi:COP9 signalosome complex subunit 7 [Citrus sinensis]|uniref:COP9 signalosome complex subunit 7 n=1 Tax=Citrus sinensis TaxID=2711 RepID=A0ACB8LTF0_CITSI|nr:COP9 signalosome complex subunit 7 [Citrus sinensis]